MRGLGLGALSHANWHAGFVSFENPYWAQLSILQAAHAAEILIKARIAEEHPLLIFRDLPKQQGAEIASLSQSRLLSEGRTYDFSELPDRLWATTGIHLPNRDLYSSFGRLRNTIQHFTYPDGHDLSQRALVFIFGVIDPFINKCWGLYGVDFVEDYDGIVDFAATLLRRQIRFLISPELTKDWSHIHDPWHGVEDSYRSEMERRLLQSQRAAEESSGST